MRLRPRQQRFVDEYLLDLNASQAALRAGYSPKSARILGQQLLAKPYIGEAIRTALAARAARVQLTQDAVLHELALLAQSNVGHYRINASGDVELQPGAPADALQAVASIKKKMVQTEAGTLYETEVRLWNKPAALRMAGEHLGLFTATEQALPDIHVHVHGARDRLTQRLAHLATRHAEEAPHGH